MTTSSICLIELNTDHSFVSRRQTVTNVANYRYATIGATVLALLLAAAITLFLRRRIIRPLSAAAAVADRIAKGELQTEIPPGGADETGALLKSMTVMQDNIRGMMTRETSLRLSAENRLADALETSREGVILVAPDGRIVLANSALRDFFPAIAGVAGQRRGFRRGAAPDPEPAGDFARSSRAAPISPAMPNWNWPMAAGCA